MSAPFNGVEDLRNCIEQLRATVADAVLDDEEVVETVSRQRGFIVSNRV